MANRAYLVGSANADPAGLSEKGINYDPDTEIVAASSYCVPALWLSVFAESDLTHHEIQGYRIPTLVTPVPKAKERLAARLGTLRQVFADDTEQLNAWNALVKELAFEFLKVDGTEIWDLDPDSFSNQLPAAVRWFTSNASEDFQQLLAIAAMQYDPLTKKITTEDSPKHNLHGYAWVREVPWADD